VPPGGASYRRPTLSSGCDRPGAPCVSAHRLLRLSMSGDNAIVAEHATTVDRFEHRLPHERLSRSGAQHV